MWNLVRLKTQVKFSPIKRRVCRKIFDVCRMSNVKKDDVKLSLKVTVDKERKKVLYAVADNHFVDILLTSLALPLGNILKVLKEHYGGEAPTIGSLSSLYHSLANLDPSYFVTEGAKQTLLDPRSSFDVECRYLKLDFAHSPPPECFYCFTCIDHNAFYSASMYYDQLSYCQICRRNGRMSKFAVTKGFRTASDVGVFTKNETSFIITDDLHIFPNETKLARTIAVLGITEVDEAEEIQVEFTFSEVMKLLKALMTSKTPLSDVILNNSAALESHSKSSLHHQIVKEENSNSGNLMSLKLTIHKSTRGVVNLLGGKTSIKAVNNLYRSTAEFIHDKFRTPQMKNMLMKPNLPHGCISNNHILPLTEECLPTDIYGDLSLFSTSPKFPKGKGSYLEAPKTYKVKDDLTVTPFGVVTNKQSAKSYVKEMEVQIGLKEALSILKASLTSTSALSDALLPNESNKRLKKSEPDP